MDEKVVCVTGGNGFIGSWIVRKLLERGYTVHATLQNLSDPKERDHLEALEGAKDRLKLFQLDVLDYDSMAAAINGCQGVFHLASPCTLEEIKDPQVELLDPAVKGTLNALEASRRAQVKRVVITSSISSLVPNPNWPPNTVIDENSWTDIEYCKHDKIWYPVSKTLAEKAAWEYANTHKMDMVAIHPSTCLGPLLQPRLNASSGVLLQLLQGSTLMGDIFATRRSYGVLHTSTEMTRRTLSADEDLACIYSLLQLQNQHSPFGVYSQPSVH